MTGGKLLGVYGALLLFVLAWWFAVIAGIVWLVVTVLQWMGVL